MKWGKGSEKWEITRRVPEVRPRAVFASPFYIHINIISLGRDESDANDSIYLCERATSAPASSSCDLWLPEACRSHTHLKYARRTFFVHSWCAPAVWRVFVDRERSCGCWMTRRGASLRRRGPEDEKLFRVLSPRYVNARACFHRWFLQCVLK